MSERERVTGLPLNGRELQALRIERREGTQKEVARKLGVAEKTVQNWENGGRPRSRVDARLNHVAELANFYKVPQERIIANGYVPAEPIKTVEEVLGALEQRIVQLGGVLADVALGVQDLVSHAGLPQRSPRATPKQRRRPAQRGSQVG